MANQEEKPTPIDETDEVEIYRRKTESSPMKRLIIIGAVTGVITLTGLDYAFQMGREYERKKQESSENYTVKRENKFYSFELKLNPRLVTPNLSNKVNAVERELNDIFDIK
jgi:hypothetical protein